MSEFVEDEPPPERDGYVDIRALMSNWEYRECHNCGWRYWERTDTAPKTCCDNCFMGLRGGHDPDHSAVTEDGYIDYRDVWYDSAPLHEAHRRYREKTKSVRERREQRRGQDREVTLL